MTTGAIVVTDKSDTAVAALVSDRQDPSPVACALFTDIAGVDEQQGAVIGDDRPTSTGGGNVNVADLHALSRSLTEILDYDTRLLVGVTRINSNTLTNNKIRNVKGLGLASFRWPVIATHNYHLYKVTDLTAMIEIKSQAY